MNNKRVTNGWAMFDWANSVYSLVITSSIFPIYYANATEAAFGSDVVDFFGIKVVNTVLYSYSLSAAFLIIAFLSPLLSGIADYSGKKMQFMKAFTYLGGLACCALFFFDGSNLLLGIVASMLAAIGYAGGFLFNNAYLPEIATPDRFDRLSAKGYSLGYLGSVILMIVCLLLIQMPDTFGLAGAGIASRISFLMVGLWWMGFAQIPFNRLPKNPHARPEGKNYLLNGYKELRKVFKSLGQLPIMRSYLLAFFFFNTGVQTIMYLATLFGDKELNLEAGQLITTILLIQLVGIAGSYLFARVSERMGNKFAIMVMLFIWVGICIAAYFVTTAGHFYGLAFTVGLVMGGMQSLSRATFSKLIPTSTIDNASYFSFYDVLDKVSVVLGAFIYGLVEQLTGSMRNSSLALCALFVLGMAALVLTRLNQVPSARGSANSLKEAA